MAFIHNKIFFSRFAWIYLLYNFYVILGGSYVRATGSGAGCGVHWPLCNGQVVPKLTFFHTLIEYTHRASSGIVTIGGALLLVWAFSCFQKHHPVRKAAVFSFFFVIIEGVLGAGLVLFQLVESNDSLWRALGMTLHLATTFFLLASIALMAAWSWGFPTGSFKLNKKLYTVVACIVIIFLIGMSGALTALSDTLFRPEAVGANFLEDLTTRGNFLKSVRIIHPIVAISCAVILITQCWRLTPQGVSPLQLKLCKLLTFCVVFQLVLGFLNIFLLAPNWMQISHLLMADTLWVVAVLFFNVVLS